MRSRSALLITLALALLAVPLAAGAQQAGKVYRIAIVTYPTQPSPAALAAKQATGTIPIVLPAPAIQ